jgi:hypothetical protein
VPASKSFTRKFVRDKQNLQREQKGDVPGSLTAVAYAAVGSISLGLIVLLGWALTRLGVAFTEPRPRRPRAGRPVVAGSAT